MDRDRKKYYLKTTAFAVLLVLVDQLTKIIATRALKGQPAIPIIKNVFELDYVENPGAAFGVLQGKFFFFFLSFLVVLVLFILFNERVPLTRRFRPLRLCVLFIISGAMGNMIDRFVLKYVVDFFYFKLINFPVFNVADIYVTTATITLILLVLFYYKEEDIDQLLRRRKK